MDKGQAATIRLPQHLVNRVAQLAEKPPRLALNQEIGCLALFTNVIDP
jgi:hypothetical protein